MELISKKTCVSFVNIYKNFKKYNRKDHLTIVNAPGCRSAIGRNPGQNFLRLELGQIKLNTKTKMLVRKTCVKRRIVLHELLHLLGLFHEHQRSDRDKYLKINYKNIRKGKKINFVRVENDVTWGLPYNYDSIMNYRVNAFAKNPKNLTIKIRNGNRLCKIGMGTHEHASELDFLLVNLLYNCPGVEKMVDNFVDKHYLTKPSKHHHNHPHHHQHKTPKSNELKLIEKSLENELKEWNKNEINNKLNKNKIKRKSKKNKRNKNKKQKKKKKGQRNRKKV
uniref:Metalloendopeptidase n=2 Tax=Meloidogyne TaxID=189290 RepID=A0A914N955_MELIC